MNELEANVQKFTTTTDGAVDQAYDIAKRVVQQVDDGSYGVDAWAQSMWQLFDIVTRGSAAHFGTAIAGPCFGESSDEIPASEPIAVSPDKSFARQLSIVTSFQRVGSNLVIPDGLVRFLPIVLGPGESSFRIRVTDTQYLGAFYQGQVRLSRTTTDQNQQASTVHTVNVFL